MAKKREEVTELGVKLKKKVESFMKLTDQIQELKNQLTELTEERKEIAEHLEDQLADKLWDKKADQAIVLLAKVGERTARIGYNRTANTAYGQVITQLYDSLAPKMQKTVDKLLEAHRSETWYLTVKSKKNVSGSSIWDKLVSIFDSLVRYFSDLMKGGNHIMKMLDKVEQEEVKADWGYFQNEIDHEKEIPDSFQKKVTKKYSVVR